MEGVANPQSHPAFDEAKAEVEKRLRLRFAGCDRAALRNLPVLQAYSAYYKGFKKTYHVQLQLESILLKGKPIPTVAALVEVMFTAELEDLLLTAGHDLDLVQPPVKVDVATGHESYARINGQQQQLKAGDMFISDTQGVLSSIIYGPDHRTRITESTTRALFTTYVPAGIGREAVVEHLSKISNYARLISPTAAIEFLEVFGPRPVSKDTGTEAQ
jgi:DNA/RNA-binding domain of Phe-tRNA-synthetase-like protein